MFSSSRLRRTRKSALRHSCSMSSFSMMGSTWRKTFCDCLRRKFSRLVSRARHCSRTSVSLGSALPGWIPARGRYGIETGSLFFNYHSRAPRVKQIRQPSASIRNRGATAVIASCTLENCQTQRYFIGTLFCFVAISRYFTSIRRTAKLSISPTFSIYRSIDVCIAVLEFSMKQVVGF